jgi:hypothetical protein
MDYLKSFKLKLLRYFESSIFSFNKTGYIIEFELFMFGIVLFLGLMD